MAARLTVVLSQSASRDSQMTNLEESMVAELMMRAGMDATMIGPIEHVQHDDTDFLCVSSFNHSFAILSWLPTADLSKQWQRLGLTGEVVNPNDGHNQPTVDGVRRIYHLQLVPGLRIDQVVDTLGGILSDRNVKTVSINLPGFSSQLVDATGSSQEENTQSANGKSSTPQVVAQVAKAGEQIRSEKPPKERDDKTDNVMGEPHQTNRPQVTQGRGVDMDDEPAWEHLEKLVDDFDSLDL